MKKIIYISILTLLSVSCTKFDNYPTPSETLKGTVVNKTKGKGLETELGGNGIRLKLMELSWSDNPTPYYFFAMQNGAFNNTKIFKGNYTISAEGPFVPLVQSDNAGKIILDNSITKEITGVTEQNFEIEPFLNLEWVDEPVANANGTITANIRITRGTSNTGFQQNVIDLNLYVCEVPYVGENSFASSFSNKQTGNFNAKLDQIISITTKGTLIKRDWYIRAGARIDYTVSGVKRYNYTSIKTVTIK